MQTSVSIENLKIECLIGAFDIERTKTQTIILNLNVDVNATKAATTDRLHYAWDYSEWAKQLGFILQSGRFRLLEYAAQALLGYLFLPQSPDFSHKPKVMRAQVGLTKSVYLPEETTARVIMKGVAKDFMKKKRTKMVWGFRDLICQNDHVTFVRNILNPGEEIPKEKILIPRHDFILSGELTGLEGVIKKEIPTEYKKNEVCFYKNNSKQPVSFLSLTVS